MIIFSMSAGGVIGPTLGGFLMERSLSLAFVVAAAIALAASLLVLVFVRESLRKGSSYDLGRKSEAAFRHVLRNKPFLGFCGVYAVHSMCTIMLMTLLPVYANEHHAIRESQTGLILSVGALMPVLFQYMAARIASHYNPLRVLTVGALFYAAAMGTVAVGTSFWAFLAGLCLLQIGLLISAPTASTITANAAPPTMRGRYMSMLSLAGWVGFGLGPLVGGSSTTTSHRWRPGMEALCSAWRRLGVFFSWHSAFGRTPSRPEMAKPRTDDSSLRRFRSPLEPPCVSGDSHVAGRVRQSASHRSPFLHCRAEHRTGTGCDTGSPGIASDSPPDFVRRWGNEPDPFFLVRR